MDQDEYGSLVTGCWLHKMKFIYTWVKVSQVRLGFDPLLRLVTTFWTIYYILIFVLGRPLWRQCGSVRCHTPLSLPVLRMCVPICFTQAKHIFFNKIIYNILYIHGRWQFRPCADNHTLTVLNFCCKGYFSRLTAAKFNLLEFSVLGFASSSGPNVFIVMISCHVQFTPA